MCDALGTGVLLGVGGLIARTGGQDVIFSQQDLHFMGLVYFMLSICDERRLNSRPIKTAPFQINSCNIGGQDVIFSTNSDLYLNLLANIL